MKELFDKISSYNLFNYLLPGILYVAIVSEITGFELVQSDVLIGAFLYYFIGLTISRIGSIIIEPLFKKVSFIKFSEYKDFIKACKEDPKIEVLSETNNMYRTLISLFFVICLTKSYYFFEIKYPNIRPFAITMITILCMIMFAFAYKKQTSYISKRINAILK